MLKVRKLDKIINKKEILSNISLEFNEGQIYTILGGNGSGKTTLFQCISGDLKYENGDINIKHGNKAMLAHKHGMLPVNLTGYQFMQFVCANAQDVEHDEIEWIDEIFNIVKISEETRHTLIKEYDFISKRKLQLAQFLVQKPYTMMFDEPFDYRDNTYIEEFLEVLNSLKEHHIILISTGLLDIAKKISADVIVLSGRQACLYNKKSLKNQQIEKSVLAMLGEDTDEE